jgi:DNA topoisomerase VI subunit A
MWQIIAIVYEILKNKKTMTQRELYYMLAKHFRSQQVFTLSVLALTSC